MNIISRPQWVPLLREHRGPFRRCWVQVGLCLALLRFLSPAAYADEPDYEVQTLLTYSYKSMPERFDLMAHKFPYAETYDHSSKLNNVDSKGSALGCFYKPLNGRHLIFVLTANKYCYFILARSLETNGQDVAAVLNSPEPVTWERLKDFMELISSSPNSSVFSETYPVDEKGELDLKSLRKGFGKPFGKIFGWSSLSDSPRMPEHGKAAQPAPTR